MELTENLKRTIVESIELAQERRHEYVMPEHFLYVLCDDKLIRELYEELGGDPDVVKDDLEAYFEAYCEEVPEEVEDYTPELSHDMQAMLEMGALQAHTSGRNEISFLHTFRAMMQLKDSHALFYLTRQGVAIDAFFLSLHETLGDDSEGTDPESVPETPSRRKKAEEWKQYVTCLNDRVNREDAVPLIGREKELERLMLVLCRKEKNNPLLIGEAGVGKTAIAYGFVRKLEEGSVPEVLAGSRVFSVDMGTMVAGTQYRGDFEKRMESVLKGISEEEKPIIYLDEIHNIVGAGATSGGTLDASNILKPYMTDGHIRFIGSTTYAEYRKSFSKNQSLVRRFQNIDVEEPTAEETERILKGLRPWYEGYHHVTYPEEILSKIVSLSGKYRTEVFQPDKAVDLMDEAGAYLHLHGKGHGEAVTEEVLQTILTEFLRIPRETVASDEIGQLRDLPEKLRAEVFGQDEAVDAVCRSIRLSRAGLNEEAKPVASLLFVGPTGVGKTEIARVLAKAMGIPLLRFDMSEYMEKHAVAKFLGAPAGYVGYEEGGRLTDEIRKNPHCVLLLDEIEKAHPDIMNVLLQVMDYATVTDSQGVKADFRHVILIMTSNAGASDLVKERIGFGDGGLNTGAIDHAVKNTFSPEFRNRLTDIIPFHSLTEEMAIRIVEKQLKLIEERLSARDIRISWSDALKDHIREEGTSREYGAREIQRVIDREVKPVLADRIVLDQPAEFTGLHADWQDSEGVVISSLPV